MLKLLLEHLAPYDTPWLSTHFSKRLVSYQQDASGVTLHFADGSIAEADIIVGGDGIKSKTRAAMYEYAHARDCVGSGTGGSAEAGANGNVISKDECGRCGRARPRWTGTVIYRYLIPMERMMSVNPNNQAVRVKALLSVRLFVLVVALAR